MELSKGDTAYNTTTSEEGIVSAVWLNEWTGQRVVNVRVDGVQASWHINDVTDEALTPAVVAVQVLDEVTVTSDGSDELFATVLTVNEDTVFVALTDYEGEYVTLDKRHIVRNITRTEKAA